MFVGAAAPPSGGSRQRVQPARRGSGRAQPLGLILTLPSSGGGSPPPFPPPMRWERMGGGWSVFRLYPGRRPACAALRRALPWAGMSDAFGVALPWAGMFPLLQGGRMLCFPVQGGGMRRCARLRSNWRRCRDAAAPLPGCRSCKVASFHCRGGAPRLTPHP